MPFSHTGELPQASIVAKQQRKKKQKNRAAHTLAREEMEETGRWSEIDRPVDTS